MWAEVSSIFLQFTRLTDGQTDAYYNTALHSWSMVVNLTIRQMIKILTKLKQVAENWQKLQWEWLKHWASLLWELYVLNAHGNTGLARAPDTRPILRHPGSLTDSAVSSITQHTSARLHADPTSDTARWPGTPDHTDATVWPHTGNQTATGGCDRPL